MYCTRVRTGVTIYFKSSLTKLHSATTKSFAGSRKKKVSLQKACKPTILEGDYVIIYNLHI